jgi:hypothetical protein
MSCLGPTYNPQPPREWSRFSTPCTALTSSVTPQTAYNLAMLAKGNVLQYKKNSSNITKNQRYSQIARGSWTNRNTTWATQSATYTNPNTSSLKRNGYSGSVDGVNTVYDPRICPPLVPLPDNDVLPTPGSGGDESPEVPPQPPNPPGPVPPVPIIPEPVIPDYIIPDGGTLQCNVVENFCSGKVDYKTRQNFCNPTSDSDVPGPIILLCYNSGINSSYYPKTKLTYGTSDNKWPVNAKFIFPA